MLAPLHRSSLVGVTCDRRESKIPEWLFRCDVQQSHMAFLGTSECADPLDAEAAPLGGICETDYLAGSRWQFNLGQFDSAAADIDSSDLARENRSTLVGPEDAQGI